MSLEDRWLSLNGRQLGVLVPQELRLWWHNRAATIGEELIFFESLMSNTTPSLDWLSMIRLPYLLCSYKLHRQRPMMRLGSPCRAYKVTCGLIDAVRPCMHLVPSCRLFDDYCSLNHLYLAGNNVEASNCLYYDFVSKVSAQRPLR